MARPSSSIIRSTLLRIVLSRRLRRSLVKLERYLSSIQFVQDLKDGFLTHALRLKTLGDGAVKRGVFRLHNSTRLPGKFHNQFLSILNVARLERYYRSVHERRANLRRISSTSYWPEWKTPRVP